MRKFLNNIISVRVAGYGSLVLGLSCGPSHPSGEEAFEDGQNYKPKPHLSCTVKSEDDGVRVSCPDGTSQLVPNGKNGAAGSDGLAGAVGTPGAPGVPGSAGRDGVDGSKGEQGVQGTAGTNGSDGKDGVDGISLVFASGPAPIHSCLNGGTTLLIGKDLNRNGVLDLNPMEPNSDGPFESIILCNGLAGADGAPGAVGPSGAPGPQGPQGLPGVSTNVGFIDPCGDKPGIIDEVILKISDGNGGWVLLASMSDNVNGQNTRLSILTSGNYMTSDGSRCFFTVQSGVITSASY